MRTIHVTVTVDQVLRHFYPEMATCSTCHTLALTRPVAVGVHICPVCDREALLGGDS